VTSLQPGSGLPQLRRQQLPAGRQVRIIAFITEAATVEQILLALGEPPRPLGTRRPNRRRTGTWPLSPSPNSIRVSPG